MTPVSPREGRAPYERGAIAEFGQRHLQGIEGDVAVAAVELGAKLGKGGGLLGVFGVDADRPGVHRLFGMERNRGGRDRQKYECTRPNDDRSVPTDRTHNQSSPKPVRDETKHQLSTKIRVQYQGEEIVNARSVAGMTAGAP